MKLDVSLPFAGLFVALTLSACGGSQTQTQGQGATSPSETGQAAAADSGNRGMVATSDEPAAAGMGANRTNGATGTTPPASAERGAGGAGGAGAAASTSATTPTSGAAAGSSGTAPASDMTATGAGAGPAAADGAMAPAEGPPEACDPADMTPDPKPVDMSNLSDMGGSIGPTKGPEMPLIEVDPSLADYTIYRPATFMEGKKYPIIVWANGGCSKDGLYFARFLLEIASNGFVIVAWGTPNGTGTGPLETNGEPQKLALDWIVPEAQRPCSRFYRKLDTSHIAAMGQSCGGLMTLGVSGDERLTSVVIWNSGMFDRDEMIYAGLHTDIAYFIGGPDDVAYPQAEDDFAAINTVPIFYGNTPVGHFATYAEPNGGEFARVGIGWLKWQLYGDETEAGAKMFKGADCGLCQNSMWTVQKKMMD